MQKDSSITKNLGKLDRTNTEASVRIYKYSGGAFNLGFSLADWGMEYRIWLNRDQLRILSDLLVEALEEEA